MTSRQERMFQVLLRQPRHHLAEVGSRMGLDLEVASSAECAQAIARASDGDWTPFPVATLKAWLRNLGVTGYANRAIATRKLKARARRLAVDSLNRQRMRARATGIPLWDHQNEALDACIENLQPRVPIVVELPTGAGKSRLATVLSKGFLESHEDAAVVWFAHRRGLVAQSIADVRSLVPDSRLRHLATKQLVEHPKVSHLSVSRLRNARHARGAFVFSTRDSLRNRIEELDSLSGPVLVIWDECHLASGRTATAEVIEAWVKQRTAPTYLVGLSATPIHGPDRIFGSPVFRKPFEELLDAGVLARPHHCSMVATGEHIEPRLDRHGDLDRSTLDALATSSRRNQAIIDHWRQTRPQRTLVFACSIDHAEELERRFDRAGARVGVVHNRRRDSEETVELFRDGALEVLVNVEMLLEGFNVPEIDAVFVARPTTSRSRYIQMAGRGARVDPRRPRNGFVVVDFDGLVERHGTLLQTGRELFEMRGAERAGVGRRHRPSRARVEGTVGEASDHPAVEGLWFDQVRTFGVEIELTARRPPERPNAKWRRVADDIAEAVRSVGEPVAVHAGYTSGSQKAMDWIVEWDSTVGWELKSPVLEGLQGAVLLARVLEAVDELVDRSQLRIDYRCGTHVHLGWAPTRHLTPPRLLRHFAEWEGALATLVSPSRIAGFDPSTGHYDIEEHNEFCQGIRDRLRTRSVRHDRYQTLNLTPLEGIGTVEVRMHNGTTDAAKLLTWISLLEQLLTSVEGAAARGKHPRRIRQGKLAPDGDIVGMANARIQRPDARFLKRLEARRGAIAQLWSHGHGLESWRLLPRGWQHCSALALARSA